MARCKLLLAVELSEEVFAAVAVTLPLFMRTPFDAACSLPALEV